MTPETLLPASSSGERRRAAQEPRPPVHAWDPNGPSAPVATVLWDALRDSVLWAEAEWERVVEHAAGAEEATAHLAHLSAAGSAQPTSGARQ